ncbi:MAG: DNA-3-methyladenine glycosylase I [Proteobacteria bacterium]|nr:DNA-3-methyladenine glycosylase I [Pseudomonadota bacterium]
MARDSDWRQRTAVRHADGLRRCAWCGEDPLYVRYHDLEWGRPLHDEHRLFEMLCLEGAQAGLSWITVLRKRESYRQAFARFDPRRMLAFDAARRARLMHDPGIVRNRLKIEAFFANARAYLDIKERGGSFEELLWQFTGGRSLRRRPLRLADFRASSPQSDAMSRELRRRGFRFVGTTTCHAFMQAVGIMNEHQRNCWAGRE